MRNTIIKEMGPYHWIFELGDEQRMVFVEGDDRLSFLKQQSL